MFCTTVFVVAQHLNVPRPNVGHRLHESTGLALPFSLATSTFLLADINHKWPQIKGVKMKCEECNSCKDVCSDHLPARPAGSHFCVGIKQLDKRSLFVCSQTAQYVLSHINLKERCLTVKGF